MQHRAPSGAATLLVVSLAVAACGGGASPTQAPDGGSTPPPTTPAPTAAATDAPDPADPTPGTALNACEIITPADIEAIMKTEGVEDGELKANPTSLSPGRTECTYGGDWGRVIVQLTPEDGANLYDAARGSYGDASDITGPWDGAFNSNQNKRAFVWKGAVTAMFTMFPVGMAQYDFADALANAAVAKL
ncbi:MAG: hypothetical protein FIA92_07935 [Chloroflexi bacterium]|nr:hypothetical protein [Chloroflexota bacterium]